MALAVDHHIGRVKITQKKLLVNSDNYPNNLTRGVREKGLILESLNSMKERGIIISSHYKISRPLPFHCCLYCQR